MVFSERLKKNSSGIFFGDNTQDMLSLRGFGSRIQLKRRLSASVPRRGETTYSSLGSCKGIELGGIFINERAVNSGRGGWGAAPRRLSMSDLKGLFQLPYTSSHALYIAV
jgi:hypothetical protein